CLSHVFCRFFFCFMICRAPRSTLFPYTTLFRSSRGRVFHCEFRFFSVPGQYVRVLSNSRTRSSDTGSVLAFFSIHWEKSRSMSSDRKSTRLNSSHVKISYAVFCLKKKTEKTHQR